MAIPLSPKNFKGFPTPFLITPLTREEATCGQATLIATGDLDAIIKGIKRVAPERKDLVKKFERLRGD